MTVGTFVKRQEDDHQIGLAMASAIIFVIVHNAGMTLEIAISSETPIALYPN